MNTGLDDANKPGQKSSMTMPTPAQQALIATAILGVAGAIGYLLWPKSAKSGAQRPPKIKPVKLPAATAPEKKQAASKSPKASKTKGAGRAKAKAATAKPAKKKKQKN